MILSTTSTNLRFVFSIFHCVSSIILSICHRSHFIAQYFLFLPSTIAHTKKHVHHVQPLLLFDGSLATPILHKVSWLLLETPSFLASTQRIYKSCNFLLAMRTSSQNLSEASLIVWWSSFSCWSSTPMHFHSTFFTIITSSFSRMHSISCQSLSQSWTICNSFTIFLHFFGLHFFNTHSYRFYCIFGMKFFILFCSMYVISGITYCVNINEMLAIII